jgi:hypothetical protein
VTIFGFIEREFSTAKRTKKSLKPKTKNHQITKASSAHLTLEGEGDTFRFYRTRILNSKAREIIS